MHPPCCPDRRLPDCCPPSGPVTYDDMPGDESVITAFRDDVMTRPVTSRVSIARCPAALPFFSPWDTIRAAVRCATLIPSPSRRMTLRARLDAAGPPHRSIVSRACALAPSAVRASMATGPAVFTLKRRRRKLVVFGAAFPARSPVDVTVGGVPVPPAPRSPPAPAASTFREVTSRPLIDTCSRAGGSDPSDVASTRISNSCPTASTAPSAGMMRIRVSAVALLAIEQKPIVTTSQPASRNVTPVTPDARSSPLTSFASGTDRGYRKILFHEIGMLVEREAVRLQRVLRCIGARAAMRYELLH